MTDFALWVVTKSREEEGIWGFVNSAISLSLTLTIISPIVFTLLGVLISIASKNVCCRI